MDQQLRTNQWGDTPLGEGLCSSTPNAPVHAAESPQTTFESAIDEVELVEGHLRRKGTFQHRQATATDKAPQSKRAPRRLDTDSHLLTQARNLLNIPSNVVRGHSSPGQDTSSLAVPSLDAGSSSTADSVEYGGRQRQKRNTDTTSTSASSAEIILNRPQESQRNKTSKGQWAKSGREPSWAANGDNNGKRAASAIPSNETDYGAGIGLRREAGMEQTSEWDAPGVFVSTEFDENPHLSNEQIREHVKKWLPNSEEAAQHCTVPLRSVPTSTREQALEIAPRTWYPLEIDGETTSEWWNEHLKNPWVEDATSPWWARYPNPVAQYLLTLSPSEAPIDPTDNEMGKIETQTSQSTSQRFLKTNIGSSKHKKFVKAPTKDDNKEQKTADVLNNIGYAPMYNEFSPRLNIFIRPAEAKDIPEIREIYNHYIKRTIVCPEMDPLGSGAVRGRMEDIEEAKLPFLVAVDRAGRPMQLSGRGRSKPPKKETVVGFAFADDYNDMRGMYRYTVEVELLVDESFVRFGVGRCLLDKTIHVLDSGYNARGGYDFITDSMGYSAGGRRTIACIIIHVPYSRHTTKELEWKSKWLEGFGFEQSGNLKDIGRKQSQAVSLATFSRQTMVMVDEQAV